MFKFLVELRRMVHELQQINQNLVALNDQIHRTRMDIEKAKAPQAMSIEDAMSQAMSALRKTNPVFEMAFRAMEQKSLESATQGKINVAAND